MGNVATGLFRDRVGSQRQQTARNYQFFKDKSFQVKLMNKKFEMEKELLASQKEGKPKSAMGSIFAGLTAAAATAVTGGGALPALALGAKAAATSEIAKAKGVGAGASALSGVASGLEGLSKLELDKTKQLEGLSKLELDKTKQSAKVFNDIADMKKTFTDESIKSSLESNNPLLLKKRDKVKDFTPSEIIRMQQDYIDIGIDPSEAMASAIKLAIQAKPDTKWTEGTAEYLSLAGEAMELMELKGASKQDMVDLIKEEASTPGSAKKSVNAFTRFLKEKKRKLREENNKGKGFFGKVSAR